MQFPIDLSMYNALTFEPGQASLSQEQKKQLIENIALIRSSIIFFTALANTKGLGGHTGGAYDIVPELLIIDGFMKRSDDIFPVYFDEAGHRVAAQYIMAVLNGYMVPEDLFHYREFNKGLYGHPEKNEERGIFFSSGRLGHLWSYVNGIAEAHPMKKVVLFGSDGSQQEGSDAEAARYAVARGLDIKLLIDDNDVTIAGHPSQYMKGFDVGRTLAGHGLEVTTGEGEEIENLFVRISKALARKGPEALINKRLMAPGVPGIQGVPKGHDVIPVEFAIEYLKSNGYEVAAQMLTQMPPKKEKPERLGSSKDSGKNRDSFGTILCDILSGFDKPEKKVLVVDSDLEGSCGLHHIRKKFPKAYVSGGIMERNNFSAAAGFGSQTGKQGVFGTFAAFLEMIVSEITMARLNNTDMLIHFSHSGVDDMADNTCHFGINNFFADNGVAEGNRTSLYYPADTYQLKAVMEKIFNDRGLRFIFSTRSATPYILKEDGSLFYDDKYKFIPGKDEIIREGKLGYIVSYGEMLYRSLDAVEQLKSQGIDVGLINKTTLNMTDEECLKKMGCKSFVMVVEAQNIKTGLGAKMGSYLLERGFTPKFARMGTVRDGRGGLAEQINYQGLETADIIKSVKALL